MLSDDELDKIRERCKATSLGPWISFVEGRDHLSGSNFIKTGEPEGMIELSGVTIADQDFIASAKQDVLILLDEIYALKEKLGRINLI